MDSVYTRLYEVLFPGEQFAAEHGGKLAARLREVAATVPTPLTAHITPTSRILDFSAYNKRYVALEVLYFGHEYHGFARQESTSATIEEHLFGALRQTRLIEPNVSWQELKYSRGGRTDKGVSALGQVVALHLRSSGKAEDPLPSEDDEYDYPALINRLLPPDIRVLGWKTVPSDFSARFSARFREYKYFIVDDGRLNRAAMSTAATYLVGKHDFRNFCRVDIDSVKTFIRTILEVRLEQVPGIEFEGRQVLELYIRGTAFLWHQVRCIAAVLLMVGCGEESSEIIASLLDISTVSRKPQYAMASDEPLLLYSCNYDGLVFRRSERVYQQVSNALSTYINSHLYRSTMARIIEGRLRDDFDLEGSTKRPGPRFVPLLLRAREPAVEDRRRRREKDEALVVWAQDRPGRRDVYSTSEELHLPSSPAAYIALMVRELYTKTMERLLTSLFNRLLQKIVKNSQEGSNGKFKASWAGGGGFILHNLELELQPLLRNRALQSKRASARELVMKVPWAALGTEPTQVFLNDIEIVLADCDVEETTADVLEDSPVESTETGSWLSSDSWLGSNVQSLLVHVGLNVSINIQNLNVRYIQRSGIEVLLRVDELTLANSDPDEWWDLVDVPEAWFKKACQVDGISISIAQPDLPDNVFLRPLVSLSTLETSMFLPIFAFLEDKPLDDELPKVKADVHLGRLAIKATDQDIRRIQKTMEGLPQTEPSNVEVIGVPREDTVCTEEGGSAICDSTGPTALLGPMWTAILDKIIYLNGNKAAAMVGKSEKDAPDGNVSPLVQLDISVVLDEVNVELGLEVNPKLGIEQKVLPVLELDLRSTQLYAAGNSGIDLLHFGLDDVAVRYNLGARNVMPRSWALESVRESVIPVDRSSEEEWDEVMGIHSGSNVSPARAVSLTWDTSPPDCRVHLAQIWVVMSSALTNDIVQILGQGRAESVQGSKQRIASKKVQSRPRYFRTDGLKYTFDIAGCIVAVRGDTKGSSDVTVVLKSVGPLIFSHGSSDGAIAAEAGITLGLSQETWNAAYERNELNDVPGTVPFSNVIKFTTAKEHSTARSSSIVNMSTVLLELTGCHFEKALHCCMDALRGNINESKSSPSLWRGAEKVQLRLENCSYVSSAVGCLSDNVVRRVQPFATKELRIGSITATATRVPTPSGGNARVSLSCIGAKVLRQSGMMFDVGMLSFSVEDESPSRARTQSSPIVILTGLHYSSAHCPRQLKVSSANVMITSTVATDMLYWSGKLSPQQGGPSVQSPVAQEGMSWECTEVSLDMMSITILVPSSSLDMHVEHMMGLSASFSGVAANLGGKTVSYNVWCGEVIPCKLSLRNGQFERSTSRALRFYHAGEENVVAVKHVDCLQLQVREYVIHVSSMEVALSPELLDVIAALSQVVRATLVDNGALPRSYRRCKVTIGGIEMKLVSTQIWNDSPGSARPYLEISSSESLFVAKEEPVNSRGPWLRESVNVASTVTEGHFLGLAARVGHARINEITEILSPCDLKYSTSSWEPAGSSSLQVETDAVLLRMSKPVILDLNEVLAAFKGENDTSDEKSTPFDQCDNLNIGIRDDLRDAGFSLVNAGDDGLPLLPFTAAFHDETTSITTSFVWRYPSPRKLQVILFQFPSSGHVDVLLYVERMDDFGFFRREDSCIVVDTADGQFLLAPSELLPTICWKLHFKRVSRDEAIGKILPHIYINPRQVESPHHLDLPAVVPLVPHRSVMFLLSRFQLEILASQIDEGSKIAGMHILNTLAVVYGVRSHAGIEQWEDGRLTFDTGVTASLTCLHSASLSMFEVLEPCTIAAFYGSGCLEVDGLDLAESRERECSAPWDSANRDGGVLPGHPLSWSLQYPTWSGEVLRCKVRTPMVVKLSESSPYDIVRLYRLANCTAEEMKASLSPPIIIYNRTNSTIFLRQWGTSLQRAVPGGGNIHYFLAPVPGKSRWGVQLGHIMTFSGAFAADIKWSEPIDILSCQHLSVKVHDLNTVAVEICWAAPTWHVYLRPGLSMRNKSLVPLDLLYYEGDSSRRVSIAADGALELPFASKGHAIRCWLGKGWSQKMTLSSITQGKAIKFHQLDRPSPLDESMADLCTGSQSDDLHLLVHHVGVETKTGHVVVDICPLVTLENKLLHAVVVYPVRGDAILLKPECTTVIPVGTRGGVIARLFGGTSTGAGDLHAIPLVCPPLGDLLDNDFEIDVEASARDVVYVRNFGEASEFLLPSDDSMLGCYLLADASAKPTLALQILPRATVANELSVEACLQVAGCSSKRISPRSVASIDIGKAAWRVATGKLWLAVEGIELCADVQFEVDETVRVTLENKHRCFAVSVAIRSKNIGESDLFAVHITLSATLYISNLTELPVKITAFSNGNELCVVEPASTLGLHVSWSSSKGSSLDITVGEKAFSLSFDSKRNIHAGRLYLPEMLSYVFLQGLQFSQLVFYWDPQPPFTVLNESSESIEVLCGNEQIILIQSCGQQEIESGYSEFKDPDGPENPVPLTPTWYLSKQARRLTGTPVYIRREGQGKWTKIIISEGRRTYGYFTVEIRKEGAGMMLICVTSSIRQVTRGRPAVRFDLHMCAFNVSQWNHNSFLGGEALSLVARAVSVEFRDLHLRFERRSTETRGSNIRMLLGVSHLRGSADYLTDEQSFLEAMDNGKFEALCDAEIFKSQQIWVQRLDLKTPAMHLRVDDRLLQLYARFRSLYGPIYDLEPAHPDAKQCNDVYFLKHLHTQALSLLIPKIYVEALTIGQIQVFVDVHLSRAAGLPVALDTDKSPVSLSELKWDGVLLPRDLLLRGVMQHVMSQALLSLPSILGSLQLLFNPIGLVHTIRRGVNNMIHLPSRGLQHGILDFVSGIGQGSIGLVSELSDWGFKSVVGFSRAASNLLVNSASNGALSTAVGSGHEGFTDADLVLHPICGFNRLIAVVDNLSDTECASLGMMILGACAEEVYFRQQSAFGDNHGAFQCVHPVLLFLEKAIVVLGNHGITPSFVISLEESVITLDSDSAVLLINAPRAAPFHNLSLFWFARVAIKFNLDTWLFLLPYLRTLTSRI